MAEVLLSRQVDPWSSGAEQCRRSEVNKKKLASQAQPLRNAALRASISNSIDGLHLTLIESKQPPFHVSPPHNQFFDIFNPPISSGFQCKQLQ